MTSTVNRSFIEDSKRFFLDRLTTDQQPLRDPSNIDAGPGDPYSYAGVGDSGNFGIPFDCSGLDYIAIAIALNGFDFFAGKGYYRMGTTETFPTPFDGFKQVSQSECVNGSYPIKVMIGHYGGGENSHMACVIDDWHMESNGTVGICGGANWRTDPNVTRIDSNYWNDWWVFDGTINEDTTYRTPTKYPLVLDYSGGRISGASLKRAGVTAVCRYLFGDGTNLPNKQLHKDEADDLIANGIGIVSNFEQGTQNALGGFNQGVNDAHLAVTNHNSAGGPDDALLYFSVDYNAPESDQDIINDYFDGIASVIGLQRTAAYGGYWIIKRLFDAGKIVAGWQTEAWSGINVDARVQLVQRNALGYLTIDGVQCDYNEAHADIFGQWGASTQIDVPPVTNQIPPAPTDNEPPESPADELLRKTREIWGALFNPIGSLSRYAPDDLGDTLLTKDLIRYIDARADENAVEKLAIFGDSDSIKLVVRNANRGDTKAMVIVGKIPDQYLTANGYTRQNISDTYTAATKLQTSS